MRNTGPHAGTHSISPLEDLQQGSSAAATTFIKVMVDSSTPPATRIRAADSILQHAAKAIELEDLEARLAALERASDGAKGTH